MIGLLYPRPVRSWMRRARKEADYKTEAPIEDLVLPPRMRRVAQGRRTELGRLLKTHAEYKLQWQARVDLHLNAFRRLGEGDMSTAALMKALYQLTSAYHGGSEMEFIRREHSELYVPQEELVKHLGAIVQELVQSAEDNGSYDDFLLLRDFLNEHSLYSWRTASVYPASYPELVDRFIPGAGYQDYRVEGVSALEQARYSQSLNFLRLFIEQDGGSKRILSRPPMLTHAGQYFDELELYILYDIEARIQRLSAKETP